MDDHRYLIEYEIESHGILERSETSIKYRNHNNATIEIRNKHVEPGQDLAVLTAYLVIPANSFEEANHLSDDALDEFIVMLNFTTGMKFQIGKKLMVVDWTLGLQERQCWLIRSFPGDERPYPVLNQRLMDSIKILMSGTISEPLRRALKWFSNGVSSLSMDIQFQSFWFVVEILAQVVKPTGKVPDLCSKCRQPLYCQTCETSPTHRPYPKQAIEYLFSKVVSGDAGKAFAICNEVRNMLMHGEEIRTIEEETKMVFSQTLDLLGEVAWISILNLLRNSLPATGEKHQLVITKPTTYCHYSKVITVQMSFISPDPNSPNVEDIPIPEVGLVYK